MEMHQERTLDTQTYLSICNNYIDLFMSPLLDLRSKIVVATRGFFFLRLWRLWIKHGSHGVGGNSMTITLADCFVSNQCFIDITMSCHFIVLLIVTFRDNYRHLEISFHFTGSNSCKIFFSKISD
jgi:hypothetical protein